MMLKKRARVEFSFPGWRDDERELYEIPEVRAYYRKTIEAGFPWIYWLEPDHLWQGYKLLFACACDIKTAKAGRGTHVEAASAESLQSWMLANFAALNAFTTENAIPEAINKECSLNLRRFIETW